MIVISRWCSSVTLEAGSKPPLDDAAACGVLSAWPRVASAPAAGGWPMCEAGGAEEALGTRFFKGLSNFKRTSKVKQFS